MLQPSGSWYWHCCYKTQKLLLHISNELCFAAPFALKILHSQPCQQPFSITEAGAFTSYRQNLDRLDISESVRLELALTALAANYLQLQAHKSWYFSEQGQGACTAGMYDLVSLSGNCSVLALVVQEDADCLSCLLLEEAESLTGKILPRCAVVRVLRNRAETLLLPVSLARSA